MTRIHVDLSPAHHAFQDFFEAYQESASLDVLEEVYQGLLDQLDRDTEDLFQLATAGMEEELAPLLRTLLTTWAEKEAAERLLRFPHTSFDPTDPALHKAFRSQLDRQHQRLSSGLRRRLQQHAEQRATHERQQSQEWQARAFNAIEQQQDTARQWAQSQQDQAGQFWRFNQQWFQREQEQSAQSQQVNQQWAHLALTGAQQAQLGVQQWYDFAARTQANVAHLLEGSAQAQEELVQQVSAVRRRRGGCRRVVGFAITIVVAIVLIYGLAFLGAAHLFSAK